MRTNVPFLLVLAAGVLGVALAILGLASSCGVAAPTVQLPGVPGLPTGPGGMPQLPTSLPTDFPTDLPTGFPFPLPTDFPTDLPTGFPFPLPTRLGR
ncbi:hypothetical protein [Frankia sp. CiP3]|uniref:hypothetical protein n=1 Tax=Frankia sp. CiP3 TaxID=2880971 RepID=UPI001EF57B6B|nr:hypothetical protein [Frankia sp. CiP3]